MVIDVILLIVFVYFFYLGFSRGIIRTIFVVISVFLGFAFAMKFSSAAETMLSGVIKANETILPVISFVITFLFVMIIIRLFAGVLEAIVDAADLELLNKFAGGILFCVLGLLVYSGILIFLERTRLLTPEALAASEFYPYLKAFPAKLSSIASKFFPFLDKLWGSTMDAVDNAKDVIQQVDSTNAR